MTRVKICGLTRAEDVRLAASLGADYLGFNFSAASPRRVAPADRALARAAGDGARRVGVFVEEGRAEIEAAIGAFGLDLVQLHRELREEDLGLPVPVIAVARVGSDGVRLPERRLARRCAAILFDTAGSGREGGTGKTFDWSLFAGSEPGAPAWLAGGLTPDNVAEAVTRLWPAAVDVASGVETSPGVKDPEKLSRFIAEVRRAGAARTRGEGEK